MTTVQGIWLCLAAYVVAVVVLLFVGRQRSLRLRELLMPSLTVLVIRAVAWLTDGTRDSWDSAGLSLVVVLLAGAVAGSRVWLVRTTNESLMAELVDACVRVRIVCRQSSSRELTMLLKTQTVEIRIRQPAAGLQLLILPSTPNGKFKLFAGLLRKRYPRVWPRLTVSLTRSQE
ncbi:MAG: hypothetical protein H7062_18665 [Candidatus Saccharimonas sp.]|nr:hypothetical protein [Planctomycetaceae bacterium]